MNTLQERLRANPLPLPNVMELCREAADRIDALEAENAELQALVELMASQEGAAVFTTETHSRIDAASSKT